MENIFTDISQLISKKEEFILATIYSRSGSAPRTTGARMAILPDGSIRGTIGGGLLEARVMQQAPDILRSRENRIIEFDLSGQDAAQMNMICGGQVSVLMEYMGSPDATTTLIFTQIPYTIEERKRAWLATELPPVQNNLISIRRALVFSDGTVLGDLPVVQKPGSGSPIGLFNEGQTTAGELPDLASSRYPTLVKMGDSHLLVEPVGNNGVVFIFGGGHISQKLAPLTNLVGFQTVVVDDRPEFLTPDRFPLPTHTVYVESFQNCLDQLQIDEESYLVIVTRGHVHDRTVLSLALKSKAIYIGMIGSLSKRDATYQKLIDEEGFSVRDFVKVKSPIGLPIGAETPEEIAICIAAEVIQTRAQIDK